MRKDVLWRALACCLMCALLCGCRVRTTGARSRSAAPGGEVQGQAAGGADDGGEALFPEEAGPPEEDSVREDAQPGDDARENPESSRKTFDENAGAEVAPGSERTLHDQGEGNGAFPENEEAGEAVSRLNEGAAQTASRTVAAPNAERMGVSKDANEADSAMTYYTVLLKDRLDSLYECQRLTAYWETAEDHVTVYRTSQEHQLLLDAGCYDAAARLLPENLRVDDGWIARKNPGIVVKMVGGSVLGGTVFSDAAARGVYESLLARPEWGALDAVRNRRVLLLSEELLETPWLRTAAALMIAKTAAPSLFEDVEPDATLNMLAEEATGALPAGLFYYAGQGGPP